MLITSSAAGDIAVTQQCSTDDVTWYDPETAAAAAGVVDTSISVAGTYYMSYTPVLCDYIRFKVVENGTLATNVSIELIYRVEV